MARKPTPRPRAVCPVCGVEYSVRRNGDIVAHHVPWSPGSVRWRRVSERPYCPGGGTKAENPMPASVAIRSAAIDQYRAELARLREENADLRKTLDAIRALLASEGA